MADSQAFTLLSEVLYDDPSQLSQALRQRAGSAQALHLTTSTESSGSLASVPPSTFTVPPHPLLGAVPQLLPAAPEHHAPSLRRVAADTSTRSYHVQPGVPKHNSAPISTAPMDAAIAPKMHHSFAAMDAPGDTQPDSQMHREWTSGIFGTAETTTRMPSPRTGLKSLFTEHDDEDDGEPLTDGVEVIVSSQLAQHAAITSPTALEDDCGQSLRTDDAFTSPLKFETPAVAGRKRNSPGQQMLSSTAGAETTPDTVASPSAFGGAFGRSGIGQPLSLTQAFDLTQARTSPVIAGTEDPVFQRPSPNFHNARHSSPIPALSSPIKVMRHERSDPVMRSSSEPRSEYVTMKESQERRKLTKRAKRAPLVQEDSWEELSAAQKRLQRQRQREQSHREAGVSLSSISAPAAETAHGVQERKGDAPHAPKAQHLWHDGVQEEEEEEEEDDDDDDDVAMRDASQHPAFEGDEVERAPEEVSQDAAVVAQLHKRPNRLENGVQVPKTSSHPQRTQQEHMSGRSSQQVTPSSQLQRESQIQAPASQSILRTAPYSSRGSVAVMDSQPDVTAGHESWPRPDTRFPSSPSINQYSINQTTVASKTGYTSQMISSSMIQMPPGPSPNEEKDAEEEERVPSSPPMLTDDLTYDEHGYEEHPDEDEDHESVDMVAGGADVRMEEEDDLPVAEPKQAIENEGSTVGPDQDDMEETDAGGTEIARPIKIDDGTDQEIPETLEEDLHYHSAQDKTTKLLKTTEAGKPSESAMLPPSLQRQTTIPDTDVLDETQPSWFTEEALPPQEEALPTQNVYSGSKAHEDTNGTEPFSTAQEQHTASQSNVPVPTSSRDEGSDPIHDVRRIRSLHDIANLPNTQRSVAEEEIDIPCLSGFDDANGDTHMSSPVPATPAAKRRRTVPATQSSVFCGPAKQAAAREQVQKVLPSPTKLMQQMREETPPTASAQEREKQGALAAVQARENVAVSYGKPATLKSKRLSRPARPKNSKRGSLKSARAVIATMSSPMNSPSKPKASATTQTPAAPATPTRKAAKLVEKSFDVEMHDAGDSADELANSPPPSASRLPVRLTPNKAEIHTGEVVVPNRVFASWPGSHYYPATCTGRSDSKQLQVRFDDGNTTSLDLFQVRALDLRSGDQVKVDKAGMKKHTYIVVGLTNKCNDLHNYEFPMTDRYGHVCVVLEEKQRDSLPPGNLVPPAKQVTVHITNVYLTTQLWSRLRNRTFQLSPPSSPSKPASQMGTPVPTEALTTPSFTRRGFPAPSLLKDATNRAGSVSSSSRSGSSTFSNMAFVLTSTGDGMDKDAIARTIKTNGGRVLEQGFHELFDTELIELSASQSRRTSVSGIEEGGVLTLKEEFKKLGFVALITDSHSRSTKYLQALALNVPCLHLRWVNDSLSATHALSFARYLLPAGLSKYLDPNGIVRSRAMRIYDPSSDDVSFEKTFQDREPLLQGQSVLLVTGKSKKDIEKRQPFVFLTHALGASNVGRCADLSAATQHLTQGHWDWVYVDSDQSSVADAAAELFGTAAAPTKAAKSTLKKGKKRKRDDGEPEELLVKGDIAGRIARVASAEFVIQSLILGALVDE
ncbi:UbiD family decarboxylase [Stagonosporopsis vannaccii]|nr:UbiD family decarboxylase [Stagonosporopsis vannaccii]